MRLYNGVLSVKAFAYLVMEGETRMREAQHGMPRPVATRVEVFSGSMQHVPAVGQFLRFRAPPGTLDHGRLPAGQAFEIVGVTWETMPDSTHDLTLNLKRPNPFGA